MPELLIGCGSDRTKKACVNGKSEWTELVRLDHNSDHSPDIVWDLNTVPLPFDTNTFDECHAYEVLEHVGRQGDAKFFFDQFSDFWRILKPNGLLVGTCPHWKSKWAWGDPSHTRVVSVDSFIFLSQPNYDQVGKSPMSDFRNIYKADFDLIHSQVVDNGDGGITQQFALKAIKPSRYKK